MSAHEHINKQLDFHFPKLKEEKELILMKFTLTKKVDATKDRSPKKQNIAE